jgi:hypothetical protein
MKKPTIDRDEQILSDELPDAALEIAAAKYGEVGNPFTIAFCTGLDTCPAWKLRGRSANIGPAFFTTAHDTRHLQRAKGASNIGQAV